MYLIVLLLLMTGPYYPSWLIFVVWNFDNKLKFLTTFFHKSAPYIFSVVSGFPSHTQQNSFIFPIPPPLLKSCKIKITDTKLHINLATIHDWTISILCRHTFLATKCSPSIQRFTFPLFVQPTVHLIILYTRLCAYTSFFFNFSFYLFILYPFCHAQFLFTSISWGSCSKNRSNFGGDGP